MAWRRALTWSMAIPLMLAGSQIAHALAYRIVYPQAQLRARDLLVTGHGYLTLMPRVAGVAFAIELLVVVNLAIGTRGRGPVRGIPAWAFAVLPAIGFSGQEFLERLLALHTVPWWMVEQPTFRVGLALQLPFGLASYLVARLLLRAAHAVREVLQRRRPIRRRRPLAATTLGAPAIFRPRIRISASGCTMRGPPPFGGHV